MSPFDPSASSNHPSSPGRTSWKQNTSSRLTQGMTTFSRMKYSRLNSTPPITASANSMALKMSPAPAETWTKRFEERTGVTALLAAAMKRNEGDEGFMKKGGIDVVRGFGEKDGGFGRGCFRNQVLNSDGLQWDFGCVRCCVRGPPARVVDSVIFGARVLIVENARGIQNGG